MVEPKSYSRLSFLKVDNYDFSSLLALVLNGMAGLNRILNLLVEFRARPGKQLKISTEKCDYTQELE